MSSAYVFFMACAVVLTAVLWMMLSRKDGLKRTVYPVAVLMSVFIGFVGAKLTYYLTQIDFMIAGGWLENLLRVDDPTLYSYYGGVLGAFAGIALAGTITGNGAVRTLNSWTPAGLTMAALARFAERFLDGVGLGDYLEEGSTFCFRPLAVPLEGYGWTEWYVAVFFMEGLVTLGVAAVVLLCMKKDRFIRGLYYLCLPQILLETLRSDSFCWLFVRIEQLICMLVVLTVLVIYAIRTKKSKKQWLPVAGGLLCAGLFVLIEFVKQEKIAFLNWVSVPACFVLTGVGIAVLIWMEILGYLKWRRA